MSYILNALRKSEQERQANQPETITEQVLMPPPQKRRKTALLIGGLLAVNLLAVSLLVWYLKNTDEALVKPQAVAQPMQKKAVQKKSAPPIAVEPADEPADSEGNAKQMPVDAVTPVGNMGRPAATPSAKTPSIEELAEVKQAEEQKTAKPAQEDKKAPSDPSGQNISARPSAASSGREQSRRGIQARSAQRQLAPEYEYNLEEEQGVVPETKTEAASAARQEIPLFKDLPYDFRSSVPKMTINVFMYDAKPEDRFVVLNMIKYKAGQTTKDSVEIKEIRADGVVASFGGRVFRIERP